MSKLLKIFIVLGMVALGYVIIVPFNPIMFFGIALLSLIAGGLAVKFTRFTKNGKNNDGNNDK